MLYTEDNAELLLQTVIDSSATALNLSSDQVSENLTLLKDPEALVLSGLIIRQPDRYIYRRRRIKESIKTKTARSRKTKQPKDE